METTNDAGDRVEGVLFWIATAEKEGLRDAEGYGHGYDETMIDVVAANRTETALAYVAGAGYTDPARRPYHWYKGLVVAGAIEQALPQDYVARLWACESVNDPRPNRPRKRDAEQIMRGTGHVWDWYRQTVDELSVRS